MPWCECERRPVRSSVGNVRLDAAESPASSQPRLPARWQLQYPYLFRFRIRSRTATTRATGESCHARTDFGDPAARRTSVMTTPPVPDWARTTIVGYSDRIAVEAGEQIDFKVSCEDDAPTFGAEILRVICGDHHPDGPGLQTRTGRSFDGRRVSGVPSADPRRLLCLGTRYTRSGRAARLYGACPDLAHAAKSRTAGHSLPVAGRRRLRVYAAYRCRGPPCRDTR